MSPFKHLRFQIVITMTFLLVPLNTANAQSESKNEIRVSQSSDKTILVSVGEKEFARFQIDTYKKPILYPVFGPGQMPMTRNFPMKKDIEGEADDHPHHKSIWFAHGNVNGFDFWSERAEIKTEKTELLENGFQATNHWIGDDRVLVVETSRYLFADQGNVRLIDFETTLSPGEEFDEVKFGDTKEGTFAIRTHPSLRLSNNEKQGVTSANGEAVNSEGDSGKSIWGKQARWVHYWVNMTPDREMKTVYGIIIMDHPSNLRHPTTWHARDYGLVAANPFGLHDFLGKPKNAGDYVMKKDESLTLRYRIVFSEGKLATSEIEKLFKDFAESNE